MKHRCKSKGCDNEVRLRPFKGSKKLYPEGKCGICMSTWKRYRMTGPERDEYVANGGVLALARGLSYDSVSTWTYISHTYLRGIASCYP